MLGIRYGRFIYLLYLFIDLFIYLFIYLLIALLIDLFIYLFYMLAVSLWQVVSNTPGGRAGRDLAGDL